jgi:hypothetical protein
MGSQISKKKDENQWVQKSQKEKDENLSSIICLSSNGLSGPKQT